MLLSEVEASVEDLARFRALVKLIGFSAFKTTLAASENTDSISNGILPEQLRIFLDSCIPKSTERHVVILGVADSKLGASITEALNIKCDHVNAIPTIIRGIKDHYRYLAKVIYFPECNNCATESRAQLF